MPRSTTTETAPGRRTPTPSSERLRYKGVTVPYVTPWSAEKLLPVPPLRRSPDGTVLVFQRETPYDRDRHGVLRMRMSIARGRGVPRFAEVHALRQRRAMLDLLSQVCGRSCSDLAPGRTLFLVGARTPVREGERMVSPPVCPPCATESALACPHLRKECVLAWAEHPQPWGVAGDVYDPGALRRLPAKGLLHVPYDAPAIRWTVGVHTVLSLHGVTPGSWEEVHELAACIERAPVREVTAA